jgi:GNAT superfamily N-acetyltransferase
MNKLIFKQSKDIKDFRSLIDTLIIDFDYVFLYTILQWCGLANDPNYSKDQYWEVYLYSTKEKPDDIIGICGLYSLEPHDTKELWLGWLGIIPTMRNKGYGKEVMQYLYDIAKSVGCKEIMSYVDKDGKPLTFYKREGFEVLGTVEDFLKESNMSKIDGDSFEDPNDFVIRKYL